MVQKSRRRPPGHIMWGIEMKELFPLLGALALVVTPAMAGDEKSKESTEQSAAQEKDRAPVKKAVVSAAMGRCKITFHRA